MGRKVGATMPFSWGGAGSPSKAMWPELRPTSVPAYLRTKWHLNPPSGLTTTNMGRKLGGCAPVRGSWIPIQHNVPCGLVRPTTTNQRYRQTGRYTYQTGQQSDSIGQTALKTVAHKSGGKSRQTAQRETVHNWMSVVLLFWQQVVRTSHVDRLHYE